MSITSNNSYFSVTVKDESFSTISNSYLRSKTKLHMLANVENNGAQNANIISVLTRRSFAVARDYRIKSKFYIINHNSTIFTYFASPDGFLKLKQISVIKSLEDTLITGITIQGIYLWAVAPQLKSLLKICLNSMIIHEVVDISNILKEVDNDLINEPSFEQYFKNLGGTKGNINWSQVLPITSIVYVHKYRMFYISGEAWRYRYAIKLSNVN